MAAGDRVKSMQAGARSGWRGLMSARNVRRRTPRDRDRPRDHRLRRRSPGRPKYVSEFTSGGLPGIANRIGNFFNPQPVLVRPIKADLSASSEVADHPIELLFDSLSNTDWRADETKPSAKVVFPSKVDLLSIYVYNGHGGRGLRQPAAARRPCSSRSRTAHRRRSRSRTSTTSSTSS